MLKKLTVLFLSVCVLSLQACGTLIKRDQIGKAHSKKLDLPIVALNAIGLVLFIVPGVVAFTVDYLNGTLYLPYGKITKLESSSPEAIKDVLAKNNIDVSVDQLNNAQQLALKK